MSILDNIYRNIEERKQHVISWDEFLNKVKSEPEKVLRNIFQYTSDMLNSYVGEGKDEHFGDPESINYVYYDTSKLFQKTYEPFFPDRLFSNRFMNIFSKLDSARQNKIYMFKGPHGSGKSTFLNNLLRSFEEYSKSDEGMLYSIMFCIDKTDFLGDNYEGSRFLEIPCPSNDNPITFIPVDQREELFKQFLPNNEFKDRLFNEKGYEWVFYREPCAICSSIFQALLDKLGSTWKVFNLVRAKRYVFNKKTGSGITVYNPSDELPRTKVRRNEAIQQELNNLFKDKLVEYKYSEFAKVNNGIYGLMDIRSNNNTRFDYLHGLVSENLHKVDDIEEGTNSIFIVISNEANDNEESFKDRIEYIDMNYILDVDSQLKVYKNKFGENIKDYFLPEVLENFAKLIISTRLSEVNIVKTHWISNPGKYHKYCDTDLHLLKIDVYGGYIPQWVKEEDRKNFNMGIRKKIINEARKEGKYGISERESINLFWDFLNRFKQEDRHITMDMVMKFFGSKELGIKYDILKAVEKVYGYTVLQQIKESLYYYNIEKITEDILNYLCSLNYEIGETVYCKDTGHSFIVDEQFLTNKEKYLIGSVTDSETKDFRKRNLTKYISQTIRYEGSICNTEQFDDLYQRYIYNLKSKALKPFINNETFRQAIKDYSSQQFQSYDDNIKKNVEFLMENLQEKFGYTINGAKEVCTYVIDNDIANKFSEHSEDEGDEDDHTKFGF